VGNCHTVSAPEMADVVCVHNLFWAKEGEADFESDCTATGGLLRELKGHTGGIRSVVFSPDGTKLASDSSDNLVRIWDAAVE
jgi:WD40 repeat protein